MLLIASALLTTAAVLAPAPSQAQTYPWCAQYSGGFGGGGRNCGFTSYGQCMATVSGIGGFCERNSFYRQDDRRLRRMHREHD